jgi:hypothetical protein
MIFLASLLWNIHFPTLPDTKPTELVKPAFERRIFMETFYTHVLNGGQEPGAKVKSIIPGLYTELGSSKEVNTMRSFLDLSFKLSKILEAGTPGSIALLPQELLLLKKLQERITAFATAYHKNIVRHSTDYFLTHQPSVNPDLLSRYIILDSTGASLVIQDGTNPSMFNFATLFYCYLVVIRDYLNHISRTDNKVCPLPPILQKK